MILIFKKHSLFFLIQNSKFWSSHANHFIDLLADVFATDCINFLNCFVESDLQTIHGVLIGGTPPVGKTNLVMALLNPIHRSALITEMNANYNGSSIAYLKVCFSTTTLGSCLRMGSHLSHYLVLQDIAGRLGDGVLTSFFTTGGDATTWCPKYLLKTYGTHAYILNVLAQNSPSNFIENAIAINRTVLDQLLVSLAWFSTTTYVDLIGRYYGNSVVNNMLTELDIALIYRQQLTLAEHNIYGSSRLGLRNDTISLYKTRFTATAIDTSTGAFIKDQIFFTYQPPPMHKAATEL